MMVQEESIAAVEEIWVAEAAPQDERRSVRWSRRARRRLLVGLARVADLFENQVWLCVLLIVLCYVPVVTLQSRSNFLVNDEIYTVRIAQAPTLSRMWALEREIDLHPPVHYLLQRASLHLPAPRWFAARLPSMLAGLVASLALFWFALRRFGALFGLVAVLIFWCTPALDFAWVNRPYMLWVGFLCLLLLAFSRAREQRRAPWVVPAVFGLSLAMVGTHLLGILCLAPMVAVEVLRLRRRRRPDWPLWVALCAPALLGMAFQYQMRHMTQNSFPTTQVPSLDLVLLLYRSFLHNAAILVCGATVCFAVLVGLASRSGAPGWKASWPRAFGGFRSDERVMLFGYLLFPVVLALVGLVLKIQFWGRYGAPAAPAIALLAVWLMAERLPLGRLMAALILVPGMLYMVFLMVDACKPHTNAGRMVNGRVPIPLRSLDPSLPIVTASPMTYVEMSDREAPAITDRVYYLTDVKAAYQYAHYTLFENEDKVQRLLRLPSHTEGLEAFLHEHARFYVVGDYNAPQIWLVRKLAAMGVTLNYLGKYESSYESDDLYLVSQAQ